jgi:hypothetical protein
VVHERVVLVCLGVTLVGLVLALCGLLLQHAVMLKHFCVHGRVFKGLDSVRKGW